MVGRWPIISVGSKASQQILARLRLGDCGLAAHINRRFPDVSQLCDTCGEVENVAHFLLHCRRYAMQRIRMKIAISKFYCGDLNEMFLLSPPTKLSDSDATGLCNAVSAYVSNTRRV